MTAALIAAAVGVLGAIVAWLGGYQYRKRVELEKTADARYRAERDSAAAKTEVEDDLAAINGGTDRGRDTIEWVDRILEED